MFGTYYSLCQKRYWSKKILVKNSIESEKFGEGGI